MERPDAAPDAIQPSDAERDAAAVLDAAPEIDAMPPPSIGCGAPAIHAPGGEYVQIQTGFAGDGMRRFYLSIPENYDPNRAHKLIVGYAGRDAMGEFMQGYLGLEDDSPGDEIFAYPDPLFRDFEGWGNYGGWLLGPHGHPAHGEQDFGFTRALVEYVQAQYCIDPDRIFATGHSWGGDMSHVVACFMGDLFRAAVPVAANRPYWFEQANGDRVTCEGETAVWTFFEPDIAFEGIEAYPGEFGDLCRDFWLTENGCDGIDERVDLELDPEGTCVEYTGRAPATRYCLYGPATGHQIPPYYARVTMDWFRTF